MQHALSLETPQVALRPFRANLAQVPFRPRSVPVPAAVARHQALDVAGLKFPIRDGAAAMAGALTQAPSRDAGH